MHGNSHSTHLLSLTSHVELNAFENYSCYCVYHLVLFLAECESIGWRCVCASPVDT